MPRSLDRRQRSPDEALRILQDNGVDASLRRSFGDESFRDGLVVLSGTGLKD